METALFAGNFEPSMILAVLPEILILVLALVVLGLDLVLNEERRGSLGWVTAAGLLYHHRSEPGAGAARRRAAPGVGRYAPPRLAGLYLQAAVPVCRGYHGALLHRYWHGGQARRVLPADAGFHPGHEPDGSAADLVMLYLAIETTSIPHVYPGRFPDPAMRNRPSPASSICCLAP